VTIIVKDLSKPASAYELFKQVKEDYKLSIDFLI
jgi:hypothetical protein